jgi:hypothetical protein
MFVLPEKHCLLAKSVLILLRYPFTWAVCGLVVVTHLGFDWWFQPSLAMQGLLVVMDAMALGLWLALALNSLALRTWYQRSPYDIARQQTQQFLALCPATFADPARQCLNLAHQIYREFTDTPYRDELDVLLTNLAQLAENHATLHSRAQQFGTPEQKAVMAAILQRQVTSMQQTLQTLQTLSGHLTLLSAQVARNDMALRELQSINQGLHEVIQEIKDA